MGAILIEESLIYGIPAKLPYTPGFQLSGDPKGFMLAKGMGGVWHIRMNDKHPNVTHLIRAKDNASKGRTFGKPVESDRPFEMFGNAGVVIITDTSE
jgi:hypothetical protein